MYTNQLYDVIVIGASEEGINFCSQLMTKTKDVKVALVSRSFNRPVNIEGITKINKEVIFSSYNRGLIGLNLSDHSRIFGLNVVIAVGTKPIKSTLKNCNIRYNLNGLITSKTSPAVVVGNDNLAATYALTLAKKFKYVYLCSNTLELTCDSKYIKKLENTANIAYLPNCNVIACKNDKEGRLVEVQLDTYSSIKCTALIMSLGRLPDNSGLAKQMLKVDEAGYIITKEFNQTTVVPKIYAIGTCTKASPKTRLAAVINNIIELNNFSIREE